MATLRHRPSGPLARALRAALAALLGSPALAAEALGMPTVRSPWGGAFVPGGATELLVLPDPMAAPLAAIRAQSGDYHIEITLAPDHRGSANIPLRPAASGQVRLEFHDATGRQWDHNLSLSPVASRFGADAANDPLPRTTTGYDAVDELRIDAARLASLDNAEAGALAGWLADCGRLVLAQADRSLLSHLRAAAGCGGAFVTAAASADLLKDRPPALPTTGVKGNSGADRLALWLMPYPLVLLALTFLPGTGAPLPGTGAPNASQSFRAGRLGLWLLAVPPAATLAWLVAVPQAVATVTLEQVGVMSVADQAYRWQGTLVASGGGRGQPDLELPPLTSPPMPLDDGSQRLRASADGTRLWMPLPRRLLAERRYRLAGSAPTPWRLHARLETDALGITNDGGEPLPPLWLFIADPSRPGFSRALPVPGLAPGERWRVALNSAPAAGLEQPAGGSPPVAPPAALLPALVLPLPAPADADPRLQAAGRLIVTLDHGIP